MNTMVPRLTVRIPILWPSVDWRSNVNKTALAQVQSIPTNNRTDRNNTAIGRPKQNDRRQREVAQSMFQTAPEHFHHVWRTGDVNPNIVRVQLMYDLIKLADRRFSVSPYHENDHVA